jgi:hypothetical protein
LLPFRLDFSLGHPHVSDSKKSNPETVSIAFDLSTSTIESVFTHNSRGPMPAMKRKGEYVFDNAGKETQARFATLPLIFDPGTIRHLEARGVGPGRKCLEVGAGGGSVAVWANQMSPRFALLSETTPSRTSRRSTHFSLLATFAVLLP